MKHFLYVLIISFLAFSCQIEDDNAPSPEDTFVKYYGNTGFSYTMADMGVIYDNNQEVQNFILLGTETSEDFSPSIYVAKTDPFGLIVAETTLFFNESSSDIASNMTITSSGDSILIVGNTTFLSDSGVPVSGIVWTCLDQDLSPIINFPSTGGLDTIVVDTTASRRGIRGSEIIKSRDGNFILVGNYDKTTGEQQYFRTKINASNPDQKLWFRPPVDVPGGVGHNHRRVFEEPNGELVFIGNVRTISGEGEGGLNISYIRTNSSGVNVNGVSYGIDVGGNLNYNDLVLDAVKVTNGYAITGTSSFGNNAHAFILNILSSGVIFAEDTTGTAFLNNEEPINTNGRAITQGISKDLIIVGEYPDFRITNGNTQIDKSGEIMFMRVDQQGERVPNFEANFGLEAGEDSGVVVVSLPDGRIVIGSTVDFGSGITLMSLIKLNDTGSIDD